jgi:hypothetical protein
VVVRRAGAEQPELVTARRQQARLRLCVCDVERLHSVGAERTEAIDAREHFAVVLDVPERVRPDGDAARLVDRGDRLGDRRRLAQAKRGLALDQVAADQRADVVDLLVAQTLCIGRRGEHGGRQVRAPDRLAFGDPLVDLRFVELETDLAQRVAHPQRALLPVGQEVDEPVGQRRAGVVDVVAEDVQFARDVLARRVAVAVGAGSVVYRRDLDRRHDPHPVALARGDRLGDAADRVVV